MKVTIAVPNFNGQDLLAKNLPNILLSGADEVLVIDDGSRDTSVPFLKKEFPEIKLLINETNLGFIPSVNKLFEVARGDIVVLLNSDVFVEKDFLKNLLPHFSNQKTFAVNCHEEGEGYSDAFWKDGFFEYKRGEEGKVAHKSSWASGGSAAYKKDIWRKLGGFDPLFAKFYWEDIDISFRAIKAGFDIFWEPNSKVFHEHETTITKTFKKRYISWVQERNQLLFIWKNISDPKLLKEHRINLFKRLLNGLGVGYWIPFMWALSRKSQIRPYQLEEVLSDQEAINYAKS